MWLCLSHFYLTKTITKLLNQYIMLSQQQIQQLKLNQQSVVLDLRIERYQYLGILKEYQLHPPSIVNSLDYTKLNQYQVFLFKRVLHGLNVYTPDKQKQLNWEKKRRISKVWKRGQKVINAWKQTICNKKASAYLKKTFKHSPLALYIASIPAEETLDDYTNTFSFKDLGINYEDVILKFMSVGLLPNNFFTIKPNLNQERLKI